MDSAFVIGQATELNVTDVLQQVEMHGFAVVRGLFSKQQMRNAIATIHKGFNASKDHPGTAGKPHEVMQNFQKLIIGTGAQTNYYVPRCVRILYNPLWAEDIYGMHIIFRTLARLRNHIQNHILDYAIDHIEGGLWTAARLQHYPVGGGFFAAHRDALSPTITQETGLLRFIQIVLLITERGTDFTTGGAFIENNTGRIDLEANYGSGDILIYDGRSMHGVADIDPHRLPDLVSPNGRIVALVNLYADMVGDDARYQRYRKRDYAL